MVTLIDLKWIYLSSGGEYKGVWAYNKPIHNLKIHSQLEVFHGVLRVQWCPVIESLRKQKFESGLSFFSQLLKDFLGLKFVG
jgi:hypothetical protein